MTHSSIRVVQDLPEEKDRQILREMFPEIRDSEVVLCGEVGPGGGEAIIRHVWRDGSRLFPEYFQTEYNARCITGPLTKIQKVRKSIRVVVEYLPIAGDGGLVDSGNSYARG